MIKLVCFVKRKPGMEREAFHQHWLKSHGPLIANTPDLSRHILRYEQNHRLEDDGEPDSTGFDGVTVQWFRSMENFVGFVRDPAYAELIAPDEQRFLDRGALGLIFAGPSRSVIGDARSKERAGAKLLCLLKRRDSLSAEAFDAYWQEPHGPLFRDTPGLAQHISGYEQHPRLAADYARDAGGGFDGLAEQWYGSPDALQQFLREPAQGQIIRPDEDNFIDRTGIAWVLTRNADVIISGPEREELETETSQ